jgi:hypothetical protein
MAAGVHPYSAEEYAMEVCRHTHLEGIGKHLPLQGLQHRRDLLHAASSCSSQPAQSFFLFVRLGTAIPNPPANIGTFQFFCVLALSFFGVEKTVAAGFSIVYFLA